MSVTVGATEVLSAAPGAWDYEGTPVRLEAGAAVPLRVEFHYATNESWRRSAAMLFWQGPGLTQAIVPASALTAADGQTAGLTAAYAYAEPGPAVAGEPATDIRRTETQIDPTIDFAWLKPPIPCTYRDQHAAIVEELVERWTSPEAIAASVAPPADAAPAAHPLLSTSTSADLVWSYLSSSRRAATIQTLAAHPELMDAVGPWDIVPIYYVTRFGAEDEALDLLGTWMQRNASRPAEFIDGTDGFVTANRGALRNLTTSLVWERPTSCAKFEAEFLETPEGECCLPAAYTLAYAYLVQGRIDQWIEQLDGLLADKTLTGDRRVNWLIARAMAEEIRRSPAERHFADRGDLFAGWEWLVEAELVSESADAGAKVTLEQVSRLAAARQWSDAMTKLSASPTASALALSELERSRQAASEADKAAGEAVQEAHLSNLRSAQAVARDAGDLQRASEYDAVISELESRRVPEQR